MTPKAKETPAQTKDAPAEPAEETPAAEAERPKAEEKASNICVVPGCGERKAIGQVCSGHAIHYHADGSRRS